MNFFYHKTVNSLVYLYSAMYLKFKVYSYENIYIDWCTSIYWRKKMSEIIKIERKVSTMAGSLIVVIPASIVHSKEIERGDILVFTEKKESFSVRKKIPPNVRNKLRKRNLITIIILCLFVGSTIFGIPDNRIPLEEELDPIMKEPSSLEMPESPQTKTVPAGWNLGESVETVHSFTTKTAERIIDMYPNELLASTTITGDISRTYEADDIYQTIFCNVATDCDEPYPDYDDFIMGTFLYMLSIEYEIDVKVSGEIWVECESQYITNKGSRSCFDETSYIPVTQEHISTGGSIRIKVCVFAGVGIEMDTALVYYLFNYENSDWDRTIADTTNDSTAACIFTSLELEVDRVYFTPTNITESIRSEYSYSSESVNNHKLDIYNVDFGSKITIKKPTHWTYSSVNIDCTVTESGNDIILSNLIPTNYCVYFTSNSSYFLAIEETTSDYLSDIGFENGQYTNDWTSTFTTTIDTGIVFEGYHSVKIISAAAKTFTLSASDFTMNYYYLSFALYLTAGSITITTDDHSETINTNTDRWQIVQFFTQTDSFVLSSGSVTCYFDGFSIMESSTVVSTTDLDTYEFSSSFVVWDNYLNPTLSNLDDIYFRLFDRTAQTEISSYETITNSVGVATWTYIGSFEQKEYMIYAYTINSYFGSEITEIDVTESTDNWGVFNNVGSEIITVSDSVISLEYYEDGVGTNTEIRYATTGSVSYADLLYYRIKSNDTLVIDYTLIRDTDSYLGNMTDHSLTTSYSERTDIMILMLDSGVFDDENLEDIRLRFKTDGHFTVSISDFRFLHSAKFYFTPAYSYNIDYAEEILEDSWDFSEGDIEGFIDNSLAESSTVQDGYFSIFTDGAACGIYEEGLSIDSTEYTHLIVRLKANVSCNLLFQDYGSATSYQTVAITTSWVTTTYVLTDDADWIGIIVDLYLQQGDTIAQIDIDFIRLIHVEDLSYFTTDTTITLDSENSALVNKVYSDNQCLGDYTEPGIVPLNGTLSVNHNITRVPFARANVNKAFLYSETTQYTYRIDIASNYFTDLRVSIDAAAGLLYVGYLTYWGNTTIRIADNGSWLGVAQNEGNTIWSFNELAYGLHNFTLYFYNGGDTWQSFSTSVTIVEPDITVLALSYYEKHYDADAGHIYINYDTTWGNTTIRVSDNGSWLGVAVSGEELSIWTTTADYGLHNITVIIYNDGVIWFTDIFTFTYNQPSQIWQEVLFRFTSSITGATIDSEKYLRIFIDDQLVSAGTVTYLENFNITIYDNFNNELYSSTNTPYAAIIDIGLALRLVNFTNPNAVACRYEIWKGSYDQSLIIASLATESYYLFDSNYTLIAEALDPHYLDNIQYILTDSTFTVVVGMATISLILNTYEETDFLMSFTFTSTYTGGIIDSETYLIIFLNGTEIDSSVNVWSKDNFTLEIYDNFDNILYDSTISYSRVVAITLAMRQFTFTNMEQEATTIDIQQSGSDGLLFFPLAIAGSIPVWLSEGSYTVTHSPRNPDKETNVLWTSKSYDFVCSLSNQTLSMYLEQFEIIDAPTDFMSSIREYFQENQNMLIVVGVIGVATIITVIISTVLIIQKVSQLIVLMQKKKNKTEE